MQTQTKLSSPSPPPPTWFRKSFARALMMNVGQFPQCWYLSSLPFTLQFLAKDPHKFMKYIKGVVGLFAGEGGLETISYFSPVFEKFLTEWQFQKKKKLQYMLQLLYSFSWWWFCEERKEGKQQTIYTNFGAAHGTKSPALLSCYL